MRKLALALFALLLLFASVWFGREDSRSAPHELAAPPHPRSDSVPALPSDFERTPTSIEVSAAAHEEHAVVSNGARLTARLVDRSGRPTPNSSYLLIPLEDSGCPLKRERWIERVSNERGEIDEQVTPGRWRALFAPTYCEPQIRTLDLAPGVTDLGALVFPEVNEAGAVCVRTAASPAPLHGVLWLRSIDGLAVDRWNYLGGFKRQHDEGDVRPAFCFEHLPAGEYEVRLFATDSTGVRVDTARVSVPGPELLFARESTASIELFVRVAFPAQLPPPQRAAVLSFHRRTRTFQRHAAFGPEPLARLEEGDERRWFVLGAGCRPRELLVNLAQTRAGRLDLALELEAGFGVLIATRDATALMRTPGIGHESSLRRERAAMLAGVHVVGDNSALALTDADGLALIELPAAPLELLAVAPGHCQVERRNWAPGAADDRLSPIEFWLTKRE